MKATLTGGQLKEILSPLATTRLECFITVSESGIVARVIDSDKAMYTELILSPRYFQRFTPPPEPLTYIIDAHQMNRIPIRYTDLATISIESPHADQPWTVVERGGNRVFRLQSPIRPADLKHLSEGPTVDLSHTAYIDGKEFAEAVADVAQFSERLQLTYTDEGLLAARTPDSDHAGDECQVFLPHNPGEGTATHPVKSTYSMDYLREISRVLIRYQNVRLRFSEYHPLEFHISPLGGDAASSLTMLLAPRIQAGDV